ncbi:MAG: hypothetical protein ACLR2E_02870 [Lachnospiraceae bacterium]
MKDTMEIQTVFMYDNPVKETEPVPVETGSNQIPSLLRQNLSKQKSQRREPTEETETETPETKVPETEGMKRN